MPGKHVALALRWLGILVFAAVAGGCTLGDTFVTHSPNAPLLGPGQPLAALLGPWHSVADLLGHPPAPGQTVEVDAYYSGAGLASPPGTGEEPCAADWHTILSDRPFLAELSVLDAVQPNALPADAPWLVAAAAVQLPYHGRFRGHLEVSAASDRCAAGARVFEIEQVVRTYAQRPPAPQPAEDTATWRRYRNAEAGYSVPQPPWWRVERPEATTLILRAPQWPASPITITIHPGETHHDPYDPASAPPLLSGQDWALYQQGPGLAGYRIERDVPPGEHATAVLYSAHGKTFELSMRYPLGFTAPQSLLAAYSAVVDGFRLDAAPEPSPTPPVRQALGPGPFLSEEEALGAVCDLLGGQAEGLVAQLVSEAEARRLSADCAGFTGHLDGVWVLSVRTPLAPRTHTLRLLLDASNGRELCREEIAPEDMPAPAQPPAQPGDAQPHTATTSRPARWIEIVLAEQTLTAWEGDTPVRRMLVTTGLPGTSTVTGTFHVYRKILSMTMSGPGYSLPGVPHCMFFFESYAIHGAYWRSAFGEPGSHGCVNLSLPDAAWLWDWAGPKLPPGSSEVEATACNQGTQVVVR